MFPQWALEMIRPVVGLFSRLFWKIEFRGVENVPAQGGVIIAANHQTYIDPFWLSLPSQTSDTVSRMERGFSLARRRKMSDVVWCVATRARR